MVYYHFFGIFFSYSIWLDLVWLGSSLNAKTKDRTEPNNIGNIYRVEVKAPTHVSMRFAHPHMHTHNTAHYTHRTSPKYNANDLKAMKTYENKNGSNCCVQCTCDSYAQLENARSIQKRKEIFNRFGNWIIIWT